VILVRPARPEDESALRPIHLVTWTADVSPGPDPDPSEPVLDDETLPDVLVAEDDGRVLGYVRLDQPIPLPSHAHVLVINGLAVDPARQGGGIGRLLIEAAVDEARRRGATKLSLRVLEPNARARALYASCGFTVEGVLRREFRLNGEDVDDLLMARFLDEA
jgi:ribosomal protein S18 acetylase RimI-like enzyme